METPHKALKGKSFEEIEIGIKNTYIKTEKCYVELYSKENQIEKIRALDRNHYKKCIMWLKDTFPNSKQYLIGSALRRRSYADIDIATIFKTENEAEKALGFFNKMHKKHIIKGTLGSKVTSIYAPGSYGGGTTVDTLRQTFCGIVMPWIFPIHISSRRESFLEREVRTTEKRKKYYRQIEKEYLKKNKKLINKP